MSLGSIEKRGEGKYRLIVSDGVDLNGKRIKKRKTIEAKNEKEAKKQLALFIAEIERGEYIEVKNMTFKEFSLKWMENYAETNLANKTIARYQDMLKNTILPVLGNKKLDQIKPMHLLELYASLSKDGARKDGKKGGYSNKTIQHVHRLIRAMLELAVKWELINSNPAAKVSAPKVQRKEIDFYDEEQAMALFQALEEEPIKYITMVKFLLYTGMRRSEMMALKWDDIDFEERRIRINKAATYAPGKGITIKETKTVRSERIIYMSDTVYSLLTVYKDYQDETKVVMQNLWNETGFLFTRDDGNMMHTDTISAWFTEFIKRTNLPHITLHGLRHTNATLMLSSGTDIETVSRILGHSNSITTSNVYLHSGQAARTEALSRLDEKLNFKNK